MKFRLGSQIHCPVHRWEWDILSYQAPKERMTYKLSRYGSRYKTLLYVVQKIWFNAQKYGGEAVKINLLRWMVSMDLGSQYDPIQRYLSSSIELWEGGLCCVVAHVSVLVELFFSKWSWKVSRH